jgi:hypothetical protein
VPQFNATVVNTRLRAFSDVAERLRRRKAGTPLATWMAKLRRIKEANAWRYVAYLDAEFATVRRVGSGYPVVT